MSQKARLGSLDYVVSSEPSSSEAAKIREAAGNSVYSKELVRAALRVDKKVILLLRIITCGNFRVQSVGYLKFHLFSMHYLFSIFFFWIFGVQTFCCD